MQPEESIESVAFYVSVFAIASLATVARSLVSSSGYSWRGVLGKSFVAGFLSFSIVSFIVGDAGTNGHSHWYFLGISALIGLLAREQDKIAKALLSKALRIGKILSEEEEKKDG